MVTLPDERGSLRASAFIFMADSASELTTEALLAELQEEVDHAGRVSERLEGEAEAARAPTKKAEAKAAKAKAAKEAKEAKKAEDKEAKRADTERVRAEKKAAAERLRAEKEQERREKAREKEQERRLQARKKAYEEIVKYIYHDPSVNLPLDIVPDLPLNIVHEESVHVVMMTKLKATPILIVEAKALTDMGSSAMNRARAPLSL